MAKPSALTSYKSTSVPPYKTREDIEGLLIRVEAQGFRWSNNFKAEILEAALHWQGKTLAFRLTVAFDSDKARAQRLRALYWYLKAKIEAIQFGIVDLEQEFLPYLLVSGGQTFFEQTTEAGNAPWKQLAAGQEDPR